MLPRTIATTTHLHLNEDGRVWLSEVETDTELTPAAALGDIDDHRLWGSVPVRLWEEAGDLVEEWAARRRHAGEAEDEARHCFHTTRGAR